jgi:AhpD family alkylhydroperoxidase
MSLNSREIALISIGVSVGVNCQPCLQYCVGQARNIGMTDQEIRDAVNAGKVVRRGAANKMDRYIEELLETEPIVPETAEKGCGCGCG